MAKKKGVGWGKTRKEKWAQHVCMRLLMVDSNMEEFAWREIYPFTDSLEIGIPTLRLFGCKSDPSLRYKELKMITTNNSVLFPQS
jgi:hypothetical protein